MSTTDSLPQVAVTTENPNTLSTVWLGAWSLNTLLLVALLLALASSLGHVAYAFSTVNGGNLTEAYLSAIAIDLGLLALAGGINQRKSQGRATWQLWLGVAFFSLISVYANWLAGINHVQEIETQVSRAAQWLVSLRPVLLSGVLPILVIYLSEIVSGNYEQAQREQEAEAKKLAQSIKRQSVNDTKRLKHQTTNDTKALKRQNVYDTKTLKHQNVNDTQDTKTSKHQDVIGPNDTKTLSPDDTSLPVAAQSQEERAAHLAEADDTRQAQKEARQAKILSLKGQGLTQAQIANELEVSISTVKRDCKELNGLVREVA